MTASPHLVVSTAIACAGVAAFACVFASPQGSPAPSSEMRRWVEPITGMTFVELPPGTFAMGSPAGEPDREAGEVQHRVTLSRPTWMAIHEVTQRQWFELMGTRPSHFAGDDAKPPVSVRGSPPPGGGGTGACAGCCWTGAACAVGYAWLP